MAADTTFFGRSAVRRAVLERFFTRRGLERHVRELAREIGFTAQAVSRELDLLERAGVLRSTTVGRVRRYRLDERSAVSRDVRSLFQKTIGLESRLRESLARVRGVEEAFIYGSYARGDDVATSDIDVMVVGTADRRELAEAVVSVERDLGREVHVAMYSRSDLTRLRRRRDPFIRDVFAGPRVPLLGGAARG